MKKILAILMSSLIVMSFAACSGNSDEESIANGEKISSQQSEDDSSVQSSDKQSSAESSKSSSESLLMKSFGSLWMGDAYYIDVIMTQEYDKSKLSSSSSDTETDIQTVNYDFIIAVDFENNVAGLNMISDIGNQSTLVKDNYVYQFNHADKTYTKKLYDGQAEDFGAEFTVKICLGTVNNCTLLEKGNTVFKEQNVQYEKYTMQSQLPSVKDPTIIYYFDNSGVPVAETMETENGTTTFLFRKVSSTIETDSILTIPEGYTEVSTSASN